MSKILDIFGEIEYILKMDYNNHFNKECESIEKELVFADAIKQKLSRWIELLDTDGIDSKNMVANDIQYVIKELTNEE